jgi:choline dehydrogenase-like flavoprotein
MSRNMLGKSAGGDRLITDLATQPNTHRTAETDVLIVGAGIAGLVLAANLRRRKVRVIIMESGGLEQDAEVHPLNRTVQLGENYYGGDRGRFRCLGGTSTRWGGALLPFQQSDLSARPYLDLPAFPVPKDELLAYLGALERDFGVDSGSYEERFVEQIGAHAVIPTGDQDFTARFAKWPSFKKRNVASLFGAMIGSDDNLEVSINSTATTFKIEKESQRIASITALHVSGRSLTISAKHCVICSGAIESTRLLLLLDRQHEGRIFGAGQALGRYFYDHISVGLASIKPVNITKLNRLAGFRFVGSTMRSLRYELSSGAQERERVGAAFGHISFSTAGQSGFDVLRQTMRARQLGHGLPPALLGSLMRDLPYFARLMFWRMVYRQLLWPRPAGCDIHVVAEQLPRFENQISLASETDMLGSPRTAINWRTISADYRIFEVYGRLFDRFWNRHGLNSVGKLIYSRGSNAEPNSHADVFHPGGTTRMGSNRHAAVVDSDLRVFGFGNLWTSSTATLPSGGGANPTLTLMLLAMRLADRLAKSV